MTEHLSANVVSLGTKRNRHIKTQKFQESLCVHARECQEALELGLTSENVRQEINSSDPVVHRFLGVEGNVGESMGLSNNFALNAISAVGNYREISARYSSLVFLLAFFKCLIPRAVSCSGFLLLDFYCFRGDS